MQVEGHGGMPSGRRGLAALKFAPNDAASRNGGGSVSNVFSVLQGHPKTMTVI